VLTLLFSGRAREIIGADADVFVETSYYHQALRLLPKVALGSWLVLSGPKKCGKTSLGHSLLRHFADTHPDMQPLVMTLEQDLPRCIRELKRLDVEGKSHAVFIDSDGFGPTLLQFDLEKLSALAAEKHSVVVVAVHGSRLEAWQGGIVASSEEPPQRGGYRFLTFLRDMKYTEEEKSEMLNKHLQKAGKEISDGLFREIISSETCGYLFPLRCEQFTDHTDKCRQYTDMASGLGFDPRLLFTDVKMIDQCTRLEPVTQVESNPEAISDKLVDPNNIQDDQIASIVYTKYGLDPTAEPEDESKLYKACRTRDKTAVKKLLDEEANIVSHSKLKQRTPLHVACLRGDEEIVNMLIDHGTMADAKDEDDLTPLHCASLDGNPAVVEKIIS
jgi:guanylate kinase